MAIKVVVYLTTERVRISHQFFHPPSSLQPYFTFYTHSSLLLSLFWPLCLMMNPLSCGCECSLMKHLIGGCFRPTHALLRTRLWISPVTPIGSQSLSVVEFCTRSDSMCRYSNSNQQWPLYISPLNFITSHHYRRVFPIPLIGTYRAVHHSTRASWQLLTHTLTPLLKPRE